MPLALEPGHKFPIVLDCDKHKPEGSRPTFWARAMTAREWRRESDFDDQVNGGQVTTGGALVDHTVAMLKELLVGWDNVWNQLAERIPFSPGEIDSLLTINELHELRVKIIAGGILTTLEKKESGSPA